MTASPLTIATERYLDAGGDKDYLIGVLRRAIEIQWAPQEVAALIDGIPQ